MTSLYVLPAWLLLIVSCALGTGIAVFGQILVHRRWSRFDFVKHNEVGGFIVAVVGTLYAVTFAFVVSIVWSEYDASATRAAMEVADAATAWHIAVGLPPAKALETRRTTERYAQTMVDREWPAMRDGGQSVQGEALASQLLRDLAVFRPANAGESNVQAEEIRSVAEMLNLRHQRLQDNNSGISLFQWSILILGACIVVGFCYIFGLSNELIHNVMTGSVACIIAATFVLTYELDYPFHGDLGVSAAPWQVFLSSVNAVQQSH